MESNKTCSTCVFFWHHSPDITQPYPEFACTKGHWDGIRPDELYLLDEERDCNDFKKDESRTEPESQTEHIIPLYHSSADLPFL